MDKISEEVRTVLELIIEQRAASSGDVFKYNFSLMQEKRKETNNFSKYSIEPSEQRRLLQRLSNEGYVSINYVDDNYKWKYDVKEIAEFITPNLDPILHPTDIYINLSLENIELLRCKYGLGAYRAELLLKDGSFIVKCNGEEYRMPKLKEDKTPAQVLIYAFKHHDNIVTRDDLIGHDITRGRGRESLDKICKGSKPLLSALRPFVSITADRIIIKLIADINKFELEAIIHHSTSPKNQ